MEPSTAARTTTPPLLASHLMAPATAPSTIRRPRLLEVLTRGAGGDVTIVSGEPAAGKTSVLVQWRDRQASVTPVAWLTVPSNTTNDVLFWHYLLAAVGSLGVDVSDLTAPLRDGDRPGDTWLVSLANRLTNRSARLVLIIDDLHELRSPDGLDSLGRLIEMRPAGLAFVISTRVTPPWPIAGWRLAGRLTEIDSTDLRVTDQEARSMLTAGGMDVDDTQLAELLDRTEHWVGGVQLAALALERAEDPAGYLSGLATGDELTSTFLVRDVVNAQDDETRQFLLDVSVLDVAAASICDAIRDSTDSAAVLERCRRANLFVARLGADAATYRLHALFREILESHLELTDRGHFLTLHGRASRAHQRAGNIGEAIRHAVAAEEPSRVSELVVTHAADVGHHGRFDELRTWTDQLRALDTADTTGAELAIAASLVFTGAADETLRVLDDVDAHPISTASHRLSGQLRGAAHMVRGDVHLLHQLGRALRNELPSQPEERQPELGSAMFLEAIGTLHEGDLDAAERRLTSADLPNNRPHPPTYIAVRSWAAWTSVRLGELDRADAHANVALERLTQLGSADTAAIATALLAQAQIAWERNRLVGAGPLYARARRSVPPMPWQAVLVECSRSRLTVSSGEPARALYDLTEVGRLYIGSSGSKLLLAVVAARAIEVCLQMKDLEDAQRWARIHDGCQAGDLPWASRLALSRAAESAELAVLVKSALAARQPMPERIDTLLAAATGAEAGGEREQALTWIGEALGLAAPVGMVRRFVEADAEIVPLIETLAVDPRAAGIDVAPFFAAEVAEACVPGPPSGPSSLPQVDALVEQLSGRELEVLALLADGLSYTDIGKTLFVSRNTVKSHVRHVYTKLGVASREGATEIGRQLGLIGDSATLT